MGEIWWRWKGAYSLNGFLERFAIDFLGLLVFSEVWMFDFLGIFEGFWRFDLVNEVWLCDFRIFVDFGTVLSDGRF